MKGSNMHESVEPGDEQKRDFAKMFDLDRTTLVKSMVDRMETCLREAASARDDLKEVLAECLQAEFPKRDIEAMKKIAKLRLDDKKGAAQEQLEALDRIGKAIGFDLFDWAAARHH
jgi:uncharacterized protein (UPF0335 family)